MAIVGILFVALGLYAWKLAASAIQVKDSVTSAVGQAETIMSAVAAGDLPGADAQMKSVEKNLAAAESGIEGWEWGGVAWVPPVGDNIHAIRTAVETAQWLVGEVARPAIPLITDGLRPKAGKFDVAAIRELSEVLSTAAPRFEDRQRDLAAAAEGELIGPVADGVGKLESLLGQAEPVVHDSAGLLQILPATLGGNGPRDYLLMFQGTSEARSLGGNPAVLLQIHVEDGSISIGGFANSSDFHSRANPVIPLDPEAEHIFGDKIGRWFPDVTMPPDFPYSVELVRAFWNETVGTEVDGVLSIDPTLLSYILEATGPVPLSTGDVLTSGNAVPLLLNEVYFRYEDPMAQNAFFAEAAGGVFTALTTGAGNPLGLVTALQRGSEEGRLLYAPTNADEAALIDGTRASGSMPLDNIDETAVGVFVNDNTGSKKSYYLNMTVDISSKACAAGSEGEAYSGSVSLTSTLSPEVAATLPYYITGPYFGPRVISTYIALYGPLGGELSNVLIDGVPAKVLSQGTHLGRPVVKVEVLNDGLSRHHVDFDFSLPTPERGPISVWHTPMTGDTPVVIKDECR